MKKTAMAAVVGLGLLAVSSVGLVEAFEYLQVAQGRVQESVQETIPLGVEIDRMEVILKKLDEQVGSQKYAVAKAQVALEDAEANLETQRQHCDGLLGDMAKLRDMKCSEQTVAVRSSCGAVSYQTYSVSESDLNRALAAKLAAYKAKTNTLKAHAAAVEKQRMAYRTLSTRYEDWNQQRQLLAHRLEELRARHAAQQAGPTGNDASLDTTDLARAAQLADEIEQKLRIVEKQEVLGTSPLDQLLSDSSVDTSGVEAEVDALLGRTTDK